MSLRRHSFPSRLPQTPRCDASTPTNVWCPDKDLIFTAPRIAIYVFGSASKSNVKQVYYRSAQFMASGGRHGMPITRVGSTLVLSKSRFQAWLSKAFFG